MCVPQALVRLILKKEEGLDKYMSRLSWKVPMWHISININIMNQHNST